MQFTPLGPWGVGASTGPATEGLKVDSGRVADPKRAQRVHLHVQGGDARLKIDESQSEDCTVPA